MANYHLSVTQLKCAVLDREWRAQWLAGKNPSTLAFGPAGSVNSYGTWFHGEAEALAKWLIAPKNIKKAAQITSPDDLMDLVWENSLQHFSDQLLAQGKFAEATTITERFRSFCQRLIDLRVRCKTFKTWQDVFVATEHSLNTLSITLNDSTIHIGAKLDAIRFHPQYLLEVVDYKLIQGTNQKADLIQLAIHAHLLPIWKPGVTFCGTIEYYLPDFHEVQVSPDDLNDLYTTLVEPVLAEMFSPAKTTRHDHSVSTKDEIATQVVEAFGHFKLKVEVIGVIEGPQLLRVKVKPAPGVKVASLENRSEDLQISLALNEPPLVRAGKGFVLVDIPRSDRKPILLQEQLEPVFGKHLKTPVSFTIGLGVEGEPLVGDLSDSNTCHALVAGTAGSGKSEWLKSLVASIALRNLPSEVKFGLIDPKILTFGGVMGSPFLWHPVVTQLPGALEVLSLAASEMDARYELLGKDNYVSLGDRFKEGLRDIPYLVLVFDEFADLISQAQKEEKAEFEQLVARIAGKGRAAGVHLVLATQRPDRNVVTGLIKANLPLKICLKVANSINSGIVLDESGAENLYGRGDLLCDAGKGLTRAQGLYIPQLDFLKALGLPS